MVPDAPKDPEPAAEAEVAAAEAPSEPPPAVAPVAPPEPVSPAKEWALAVAMMIVFALIAAQFISLLRD